MHNTFLELQKEKEVQLQKLKSLRATENTQEMVTRSIEYLTFVIICTKDPKLKKFINMTENTTNVAQATDSLAKYKPHLDQIFLEEKQKYHALDIAIKKYLQQEK